MSKFPTIRKIILDIKYFHGTPYYAVTVHKVQGATVQAPATVIMDIDSTFEPAMCYVMLSRVQQLEQVFILNKGD